MENNNVTEVFAAACAQASVGMEIAAVAALEPTRPAVLSMDTVLTFQQLNRQVNQVARLLRSASLKSGDAIALICSNRVEFVVVRFACHRIGIRLTPVNWHLKPDEIAYVVDNCDAQAVFIDVKACAAACNALGSNSKLTLKVAIGGSEKGYQNWADALASYDSSDIENPSLGNTMLYTSGTTGRPKGVLRKHPDPQKAADMQSLLAAVFQFQPESGEDCALVTGPLYHSGPFNLCMTTPLTSGIGIVLMDKFDAQEALRLIFRHHITHTFMVPTMMTRLLCLPEKVRDAADISSLRFVIHGAAPCPVEVKQAMLGWFGPIIWEMFAGTEGPGTIVSPQEWIAKPGTVGKPGPGQIRVLDSDGQEVAAGVCGQLFLINPPDSSFEYYRDAQKTANALSDGYFTAGDIGFLDEDGYLFLTGRSAEVIISGGVNIYPQEIDDVLAGHPAVADVACVGVPNEEWGEEVKALICLAESHLESDALRAELIAYCSDKLASQKLPRSLEFVAEIPRSEAGKIFRGSLRAPFWVERTGSI